MRPFIVGLRTSVSLTLLMIGNTVWAQIPITTPKGTEAPAVKSLSKSTFVEIELLQSTDGGGMFSQHWSKILAPMDIPLRIHRPLANEKPEVKERQAGTLHYVTVIGTLDRFGTINFPDRSFTTGEGTKLKEWIEELKTYGARGTPTGQPLWGLNKEQFTQLFNSLLKPVEFETEDLPFSQVVAKLPLPAQYPLHWNADATKQVARLSDQAKVRAELQGFTAATALAVVLSEQGLSFRPNRTANGDLELLVEPRNPKQEQWPVGWPVKLPNMKAAPRLFTLVPIDLSEPVELSDVINAVSKLSQIPILIDYAELDSKKIHLDKIKVTFPKKTTNWHIALNRMIVPQHLTQELWQDEAGRVFVWITSSQAGRNKDVDK